MPSDASTPTSAAYFHALASIPRLAADEEHALACAVVEARTVYWQALLSIDRTLGPAAGAVLQHCDDDEAQRLAADLRHALARTRELATGHLPRSVVAAREALVARLVRCDPGQPCFEAVMSVARLHDETAAVRIEAARRSYLEVRNRFVRAHLRLVITFAKRHCGQHHTLGDRIQDGNIGLLRAIERFDPSRGVRFSSYAGWWIRHSIMRALTNHGRSVRVPSHLVTLFAKANRMRRVLASELGREPTLHEVAQAIDTDPHTLTRADFAMTSRTISLDAPQLRGDEDVLDTIADDRVIDAADELSSAHEQRLALLAFQRLPAKDRQILLQRFPQDGEAVRTLEDIGRQWGVSRERIRQLQNRALETVRRAVQQDRAPELERSHDHRRAPDLSRCA